MDYLSKDGVELKRGDVVKHGRSFRMGFITRLEVPGSVGVRWDEGNRGPYYTEDLLFVEAFVPREGN